jgi:hypothetical protein
MSNIIKFPATAYAKLVAKRKRKKSTDEENEMHYGSCAAIAWLDTEHGRDIAFRVADWMACQTDLGTDQLHAVFPPGWHFQMIHGRAPKGDEAITFWAEMQGDHPAFRRGFVRGLLHIIPIALKCH